MTMFPDEPIWQWEFIILNRTIIYTWVVMSILVCISWLVTRNLSSSTKISRGQNLLEVLVTGLRNQIREVSQQDPGSYLPFIGTLFLFIVVSNILAIVPGYYAPTSSLSTTAALATCVFIAVPIYGIANQGVKGYLKQYISPSVLMLPFNIIGELSRTLALAVRLYGNMMSGAVIAAILLGFVPLFVPILMQAFGLLTGVIQAYIFSVLAMVYIASATQVSDDSIRNNKVPEINSEQSRNDEN
ncbi:F0F1 ATP synthase subunit A [Gimesia aquarii]|uniref:ATP synthase subunit a n=1 Tax=Gimesia aquarii TaxID=2527964 RepID=A0A517WZQ2_9PLAN|nr:F0F1 ATP synthase subunit A [Gimesia aquarii]QDU10728.1 ATP synthase subunit a [Gimesia aquarii]